MSLIAPSHALIVVVGLAAGLAAYDHMEPAAAPLDQPAPFDSLTPDEQQRAVAIAEQAPLVVDALGDRSIVIGASLRTDKAEMRSAHPARLADVQFYSYSSDATVWAIVDLTADAVRGLAPVPDGYQPPLTGAEWQRGAELAAAASAVIERLPGDTYETTAHLWATTSAPCDTHRCARIAFYEPTLAWGFSFYAIVDLSADTFVTLWEASPVEDTA